MFDEQQNFAMVRTQLDTVFYQEWEYDTAFPNPSHATANDGDIFKPLNITHQAFIQEVFMGSPLFPSIGETQSVPLSVPKVANSQTVAALDFAQGIELSKNLFDDNLHGIWANTVKDFALKARLTQDYTAFSLFNNGATTTLTADGSAWFSTHTTISGATVSNYATGSTTVLGTDSLNTAMVALQIQIDQAGVIIGSMPAVLVVPPALLKHALEITDSALIADSGNNNINVYRSAYGFKVVTNQYLSAAAGGSDTQWYLLCRNHSVTRLIRQGIQTSLRNWDMSNNRTYFYQANFRENYFVSDYVGTYAMRGY